MLRFKPEVRIGYFDERAGLVLHYASVWSLRERIDVEVNSANDSAHGATTLHTTDLAWDLDTAGDKPDDLVKLAKFLAGHLPPGYEIINEQDHVHVEFDMHRKL
jgi:hypothetical protein